MCVDALCLIKSPFMSLVAYLCRRRDPWSSLPSILMKLYLIHKYNPLFCCPTGPWNPAPLYSSSSTTQLEPPDPFLTLHPSQYTQQPFPIRSVRCLLLVTPRFVPIQLILNLPVEHIDLLTLFPSLVINQQSPYLSCTSSCSISSSPLNLITHQPKTTMYPWCLTLYSFLALLPLFYLISKPKRNS